MPLNIPAIEATIKTLEAVPNAKFSMCHWGERGASEHTCRTTACISGWLVLSPDHPDITDGYRSDLYPRHKPSGIAGAEGLGVYLGLKTIVAYEIFLEGRLGKQPIKTPRGAVAAFRRILRNPSKYEAL